MDSKINTNAVIDYPKLTFRFSLLIFSDTSAHLDITKIENGENYSLGRTETIFSVANTVVEFKKNFEIIYLIGNEESQFINIDIKDGDYLGIGSGFILSSLTLKISNLISSYNNKFEIYRGDNNLLGYLFIISNLSKFPKKFDMFGPTKVQSLGFSEINPSKDSIRREKEFFFEYFGFYTITLYSPSLFAIDKKLSSSESNISAFVQMSIGDNLFENEIILGRELWRSLSIDKPPFKFKALSLNFSHEDLTKSIDFKDEIPMSLVLVVDVVLVINRIGYSSKNKLLSRCSFNIRKLLSNPETIYQEEKSFDFCSDEFIEEDDPSCKKETLGNLASYSDSSKASFQEKALFNHRAQHDASVTFASNSISIIDSIQKIGLLRIVLRKQITKQKVMSGDDFYEKKLQILLDKRKDYWEKKMTEPFLKVVKIRTFQANEIYNIIQFLIDGWVFKPIIIVDMMHPCLLQVLVNNKSKINRYFDGLENINPVNCKVLDSLMSIFTILSPLSVNRSIHILSGGKVRVPLKTDYNSHFVRNIGYPLCQEYLFNLQKQQKKFESESQISNIFCNLFNLNSWLPQNQANVKRLMTKRTDSFLNNTFTNENTWKFDSDHNLEDWLSQTKSLSFQQDNNLNQVLKTGIYINEYSSESSLLKGFMEASSAYIPLFNILNLNSSNTDRDSQTKRINSSSSAFDLTKRGITYKISEFGLESTKNSSGSNRNIINGHSYFKSSSLKRSACYSGTQYLSDLHTEKVISLLSEGSKSCNSNATLNINDHSRSFYDLMVLKAIIQKLLHNLSSTANSDSTLPHSLPEFGAQLNDKTIIPLFWILGQSPMSTELIEFKHFLNEFIELKHSLTELKICFIIVLSSEQRYDLSNYHEDEVLEKLANPFEALFMLYRSALINQDCNYSFDSLDENDLDQLRTNLEQAELLHNIGLIHHLTWSEVMAKAYIQDKKNRHQNKEVDNKEYNHLPTIKSLKFVLDQIFSYEASLRILGMTIEEMAALDADNPLSYPLDRKGNTTQDSSFEFATNYSMNESTKKKKGLVNSKEDEYLVTNKFYKRVFYKISKSMNSTNLKKSISKSMRPSEGQTADRNNSLEKRVSPTSKLFLSKSKTLEDEFQENEEREQEFEIRSIQELNEMKRKFDIEMKFLIQMKAKVFFSKLITKFSDI